MKYVRLLNAILAVAFVSGFVAWVIGAYRQHNGKKGGWPVHVFVLCWGITAIAMSIKGILQGRLGSGERGLFTREKNPKQFLLWVGILSAAGIVAAVVGASKLAIDLSTAS